MQDIFERTLIITPHCDDETIGCGGMMHRFVNEGKSVKVVLVSTHEDTYNYNANRKVSHEERLEEFERALYQLGGDDIDWIQLPGFFEDGRLDICSQKEIVSALDIVIREFKPTAVLFPYSSHHQDHQAVYNASIAALRTTLDTNFIKFKAVYEYPYITTSWNSSMRSDSRIYIRLSEADILAKKNALLCYKSQLDRPKNDLASVESIMTLADVRGTEVGFDYAEALYPISMVID